MTHRAPLFLKKKWSLQIGLIKREMLRTLRGALGTSANRQAGGGGGGGGIPTAGEGSAEILPSGFSWPQYLARTPTERTAHTRLALF